MKANDQQNIVEHLGVVIDYSRDGLLPEQGKAMLTRKGFYKLDHENSPQEGFARAATCYSFGDYEFAQRMYDHASKGWYVNASPVLSNAQEIVWPSFGEDEFEEAGDWLEENVTAENLPISCFLGKIGDSKQLLVTAATEAKWLAMMGGGVGLWAANRAPDEQSTGAMAHLKAYDAYTRAYKQRGTRRGSMSVGMNIDHPEIMSFIHMRDPVGGDPNNKCFNLNNCVHITDDFMNKMIRGEKYELVDPKHGATGRFLEAREVWDAILDMRFETGEPYIMFVDTVNRNKPTWIKRPLYQVFQTNLCSEITLMTTDKRTAVCCLSSLNMEKYDEWKDTTLVADLIRYLDNVLEYFIRLAPPQLERAVHSAAKERAVGMGTLGFHSYLQKHRIPFESGGFGSASQRNAQMYKKIKQQAIAESLRLGSIRGEAPDCQGSGMRNSHLMAIAPNASSSSIVPDGPVSPSIEPWASNAFNAQGRAGSFLIRNKYLEEELEAIGQNTEEVWKDITLNNGSVQHLDFLSDEVKAVFKTAREINPMWCVEHAAIRQPDICQSQSLNIWVRKDTTRQEMSDIHVFAWKKKVKTMYYCRAEEASKVDLGDGSSAPLNAPRVKVEYTTCLSCEG